MTVYCNLVDQHNSYTNSNKGIVLPSYLLANVDFPTVVCGNILYNKLTNKSYLFRNLRLQLLK